MVAAMDIANVPVAGPEVLATRTMLKARRRAKDPPIACLPMPAVAAAVTVAADLVATVLQQQCLVRPAPARGPLPDIAAPLPAPWQEHIATTANKGGGQAGDSFYYNLETKVVQWPRPEAAAHRNPPITIVAELKASIGRIAGEIATADARASKLRLAKKEKEAELEKMVVQATDLLYEMLSLDDEGAGVLVALTAGADPNRPAPEYCWARATDDDSAWTALM